MDGLSLSAAQDSVLAHLPPFREATAVSVSVVVPPRCLEDAEGNAYGGLGLGEYTFTVTSRCWMRSELIVDRFAMFFLIPS